ncbi:MAG: CsbD family protein [Bdellovibrionales bacterium]|nr:CsbD family protein [Bdellovibrionales bacterium]
MNENTIKGKWLEIKGDVRKAWGKLTDDELDKTKGDMKAIAGLIQQKYGDAQENASDRLSNIFKRFETQKDEVVTAVKSSLKS